MNSVDKTGTDAVKLADPRAKADLKLTSRHLTTVRTGANAIVSTAIKKNHDAVIIANDKFRSLLSPYIEAPVTSESTISGTTPSTHTKNHPP